jgi:hypothetical protein
VYPALVRNDVPAISRGSGANVAVIPIGPCEVGSDDVAVVAAVAVYVLGVVVVFADPGALSAQLSLKTYPP